MSVSSTVSIREGEVPLVEEHIRLATLPGACSLLSAATAHGDLHGENQEGATFCPVSVRYIEYCAYDDSLLSNIPEVGE